MRKEIALNVIKLTKRLYSRNRRCFSCGAPVNIDRESGKPVIYHFVTCAYPNLPWIDVKREEKLHECELERVCSYTLERKIKMMIV